ncbi:MAG: creatininase family protein [Phycisphaerales bacterium]|nr:creatininase family protein [Phycisphaerales bacterium]
MASQEIAHGGILEEMTIDEIRAMRPEVVVLPLGSTEPHGPHLPLGTDTYQTTWVGRQGTIEANRRGARALLYPTLAITNNSNMRKVPFALRIGVRTLMQVIIDIVLQCKDDGIKKIVLLNGHGGTPPAVSAVLREMSAMDDMPFVCVAPTWLLKPPGYISPIEHPSDHGGEAEACKMLYIHPELVHAETFANNPVGKLKVKALAPGGGIEFIRPWHLYMPRFAAGETRTSTAEKGKSTLESQVAALADLLVELSAAKWDERFPYE